MSLRLAPYPAYEASNVPWLGETPAHWDRRKLKFLATLHGRIGFHGLSSDDYREDGVIVVSGSNFRGWGVDWASCHRVHEEWYEKDKNIQLRQDDLLVTKDGTIGKTAIVDGLPDRAVLNSGVMVIRSTNVRNYIDRYLLYLINSRVFSDFIDLTKTGATIQHLYEATFYNFVVPLPCGDEQQRIARFLDHAGQRINRLIRAKQRLIELLNEQKLTIIHRAVTRGLDPNVRLKPSGIDWLGDMPDGWEVVPFTKSTIERADYRGATPEKVDSGVFLVTARNVKKGWIDYESSKEYVREDQYERIMRRGRPHKGDILLTMEAPLGNVALIDREDIALAQRIVRFRMDERLFAPEFALLSMLSPYFQNQLLMKSTGSTARGIKASKLPQLLLLRPPLIEQCEILRDIEVETRGCTRLLVRARREIDLLREYRTRLIADVVTGKLDVRGVDLPPLDDGTLDEIDAPDEDDAEELLEPGEDGDGAD